jgi:hypothetical protein
MTEIILALIKDMSSSFAACIVAIVAMIGIVIIVLRLNRSDEIIRKAREQVRTQELNQINHSLAVLKHQAKIGEQ